MWPANLLRKDFPNARILTYGYDSQVSNFFGGGANQNDMITIANGFLNDLAAERADARGRDLIIISHSMGGLITKEVFQQNREDLRLIANAEIRLYDELPWRLKRIAT
jgi:esterase/lipase superfamily enzyme